MKFQHMTIIGILIGTLGGFLYWKFVGCASGTCPITANYWSSSLYGALLGGLLFSSFSSRLQNSDGGFKTVSQQEYEQLSRDKKFVVIDVRTTQEVQNGRLKEATQFIDITGDSFDTQIEKLDKNQHYLVYCRSGARSARASEKMAEVGFKNVYNLAGGISSYTGNITR